VIEQAYRRAESWGIPLWCQDEAGPYQAIPHPGPSWRPEGEPAHRPHEWIRGGTVKLLTLFHPQTGQVRVEPVGTTPNAVLHPWLRQELSAIVTELPPLDRIDPQAPGRRWSDWGWDEGRLPRLGLRTLAELPPVRMGLIWDNLAGHHTPEIVRWCLEQGIVPLYTPLGGSWLNLAESIQRILVRRTLDGQHPQTAEELRGWFAQTVRGWNVDPTPFEWGGKRWERRQRVRERRYALGGSGGYTRRPIPRAVRPSPFQRIVNGYAHVN
jgi:hypothetical protein